MTLKVNRQTYALGKSTSRANVESSSNGPANGNHVEVARLHLSIKLHQAKPIVPLLEGLEVEPVSGREALLLVSLRRRLALVSDRRRLFVGKHWFGTGPLLVLGGTDGVVGHDGLWWWSCFNNLVGRSWEFSWSRGGGHTAHIYIYI